MASLTWYLLTFVGLPILCESSKILVLFPFPAKSHSILGDGIVRLLLEAGHEVTYITPFPYKDQKTRLHQVDVSKNLDSFPSNLINLKTVLDKTGNPSDITALIPFLLNLSADTIRNENVQKMLSDSNQKFDLIIMEWMLSDIYSGLSALYECPYIWFYAASPHWMLLSLIDEGQNPAYNPDSSSGDIPPFSFKQRVRQLFSQIAISSISYFYLSYKDKSTYENLFAPIMSKRGRTLPSLEDVKYNSSLMLGNSHVSLAVATRLPQSYKEVGGFHIDPKVKYLPEDLAKIIDGAKNGVIYFSMGSNLKSKDLPDALKRNLLKMFEGLKYTVIWKIEEVLTELPQNVHILKWAPQPSILSHPNCILFITHGGLLSTMETVHFGVPIIGIPVFADQFTNVEKAVNIGFAKKVELSYEMADDLKIAIEDILSDPRYREKVQELSLIYHDRPVSPGTELVHWVEHVIRTRGALHLRSPALHVPWYQKMYLDLLALIIVTLYIIKYAFNRLFCSNRIINKEKKDN